MPLSRSTLLLATLAIWLVAWAMWTADLWVEPVPFALERALRRVPLCLVGAGLCLAMVRPLADARRAGLPRLLSMAIPLVGLASLAFAGANELVFYGIAPRWGPPALVHIPDVAMLDVWVFLAWTLLFLALLADAERRDRDLALARTEALALDAQHRLLVQQAQPHFLFNALNTIYALVLDGEAATARTAILSLSDFLRHSIDRSEPIVTLEQELRSVRDYLALEALRFGDRLTVVEDVATEASGGTLPSFVLQPLVENSIKHGLSASAQPVTVTLSVTRTAERLVVAIEDDAATASSGSGGGLGHASVRQRLASLYGGRATFTAGPMAPRGYRAIIEVPRA